MESLTKLFTLIVSAVMVIVWAFSVIIIQKIFQDLGYNWLWVIPTVGVLSWLFALLILRIIALINR